MAHTPYSITSKILCAIRVNQNTTQQVHPSLVTDVYPHMYAVRTHIVSGLLVLMLL